MAEYIFEIDGALYNDENQDVVVKSKYKGRLVRCKECQHNPIDTWFECPMAHLPYNENGWCWKGEKRGLTHE